MYTTCSDVGKLPYWLQQELKDQVTGPLIMDLGVDLDTEAGRIRAFKLAFQLKNQRYFRSLKNAWSDLFSQSTNQSPYTLTV